MVFRERRSHRGVILLRLTDESPAGKIAALDRLLNLHGEEIVGRFVVVTETSIRFGRSRA